MNIPLDNLYDWMSGISRDIVIYRFSPHGSKNLFDLTAIGGKWTELSPVKKLYLIPMVCHDQEILDYDAYRISGAELKKTSLDLWPNRPAYLCLKPNTDFWWDYKATRNLASVVSSSVADKTILLHTEKRSSQVEIYQNNNFVPAYWWSHGMISRDWYRYAEYDPALSYNINDYKFDFNIYSRAWTGTREYRLALLNNIVENNLLPFTRITFSKNDGYHWTQHQFKNTKFKVSADLDLLDHIETTSCSSATYDAKHYQDCAIDVVLETIFDDERLYLTEKILRPIACGKPFILASTHGSLAYLREYGFKTFGDIIDESYDDIIDPVERLESIQILMQQIANLPKQQKLVIWTAMQEICTYNRRHFFSQEFTEQIYNELHHNVLKAELLIKQNYYKGKEWLNDVNQRARAKHSFEYDPAELTDILNFCQQQQSS